MLAEHWFQIAELLLGSGMLIVVARILMRLGAWEEWTKNVDQKLGAVDKELSAHGSLLQQLTGLVQRILGRSESK